MIIQAKSRSVVWTSFPMEEAWYREDVQQIMEGAVARYGVSEWRAAVLTCEVHGHLGIYSLLGVKMGIFALEHFPTTPDDPLQVISYAGHKPPMSCLNDGLQVAAGATLGRGTIRLAECQAPAVEALFRRGNRCVRISLKAEVAARIADDVARGRRESGGLTPAYWEFVRRLAIGYWLEMDRQQIFEVTAEP